MMRIPRFTVSASLLVITACGGNGNGNGPTEPVATTITISQVQVTLDAINATVQLTATVRDQNNQTMNVTVTWTSNAPNIVSVQNGTLTALANGPATITASFGGLSAQANVQVQQRAAVIVRVSGDQQTAQVTEPLTNPLVVRIEDRLGTVIEGVQVQFETDNGQPNPAQAVTNSSGLAQTLWTLGTVANSTGVTPTLLARVVAEGIQSAFTATALPGDAANLTAALGDGQRQVIGRELPDSIIALVADIFGNGVPGVQVQFAVVVGTGAVEDAAVTTDATGQAGTTWTLGNATGPQTARGTSAVLPGQNADFVADAIDPAAGIGPGAGMVEGEQGTLTGEGYHPDPDSNRVTVEGVPAPVELVNIDPNGDDTILFRVPTFDGCMPARDVDVTIAVGLAGEDTINHRLNPANAIDDDNDFSVGEFRLFTGDPDACLQFLPSEFGNERYIFGFGAANDDPVSNAATLVGTTGADAPLGASITIPAFGPQSVKPTPFGRGPATRALDAAVRSFPEPAGWSEDASLSIAASRSVPTVGEQVPVRVLLADAETCDDFVEIQTTVQLVGQRVAIATDNAGTGSDPLTPADLQALSNMVDAAIGPTVENYFGPPPDTDASQRVFLVFSPQVNPGGPYVTSLDFQSRAECAASNEGEFVYLIVPNGITRADVIADLPFFVTQFLTLLAQEQRVLAGGTELSEWESQGQSMLALEVVAHAMELNSPRQNYGAGVVASSEMYEALFLRLYLYFGWDGGISRLPSAPAYCSVFFVTLTCHPEARRGAAWAFARYLADRFGPGYPGGEAQLMRDWVQTNPGLNGVENVEALTGVPFEQLISEWNAAFFGDGLAGANQTVHGFRSWDLPDIFAAAMAVQRPQPLSAQMFEAFQTQGTLVAGGTGYVELTSGSGEHPAFAVRLNSPSAEELGLVIWAIRIE